MRKENDINFVSLLQNETFLNLVKNTNGLENQLDILDREFPGQRETITLAVEFIRINLSHQRSMPSYDVARIWQNTIGSSVYSKKSISHRLIFYKILKVAAVLIFILAGSFLLYQQLPINSLGEIAAIETGNDNVAVIILSDGSKHKLDEKNSKIEYSADGGEVVVKNFNQEEKIENSTTSKATTINQIIVPFGHRHMLTLSDGTRVQLNADSRLVFPAVFSDKNREVYLKGEGYFEVFKNPNKPFIVKTDFIEIKVLGTTFNISAYGDEKIASAILVEGEVVVSRKGKMLGNFEKKLNPGQGCFYSSSTHTSDIQNVDLCDYISWKDGLLLFKDKPLINIISRVEKYYNRKIQIEGDKLPATLISGKLVLDGEIDEVMRYLAKTLETSYEENDKGVFLIKKQNNMQ